MDTFLFLVIAYIGGTLGIKLKLPAGALLGSMFMVGIFKMTDSIEFANVSSLLRIASKIALGTMIGLMFSKDILKLSLKQLISFIMLGLGSIFSTIIIAFTFSLLNVLPFVTSLVAVAPGGIAEMLTLADSINVDTSAVMMIHLIRFVMLMLLLKWLLNLIHKQGKHLL